MARHRTNRGKEIDMEALRKNHSRTIAAGNANMNAAGDIIGRGGRVVKTRRQITEEYYKQNPNAVKQVNIKDRLSAITPKANVQEQRSQAQRVENLEFKTPHEVIEEAFLNRQREQELQKQLQETVQKTSTTKKKVKEDSDNRKTFIDEHSEDKVSSNSKSITRTIIDEEE